MHQPHRTDAPLPSAAHASQSAPDRRAARWLVAGGIALLYCAAVTPRWNVSPDSALYLLLGQNLAAGQGYTLFGEPHAFVPPGYPLLVAAQIKLGLGSLLAQNLAMAILSLATFVAIYLWLRGEVGSQLALVATGVVAVSSATFRTATLLLSDVPFWLLVVAGLALCQHGLTGAVARPSRRPLWLVAGLALLTASCWFRVVGLPLALSAAAGVAVSRALLPRRQVIAAAAVGLALTLATMGAFWARYQAVQGPLPQETYAQELSRFGVHDRGPLAWLADPLWNLGETGRELAVLFAGQKLPPLVALALLWLPIAVGMTLEAHRGRLLGVAVTIGYIGAILLLRPLLSRYLLPVAPLLVIYFALGLAWLVECRPRWKARGQTVAMVVLCAMAVLQLPRDFKSLARLHDPSFPPERHDLVVAAAALGEYVRPGEAFLGGPETTLSYLSGGIPFRNLYGRLGWTKPTADEVLALVDQQGIGVLVFSEGDVLKPYEQVLRELVEYGPQFEPVIENDRFAVYRRTDRLEPTSRIDSGRRAARLLPIDLAPVDLVPID